MIKAHDELEILHLSHFRFLRFWFIKCNLQPKKHKNHHIGFIPQPQRVMISSLFLVIFIYESNLFSMANVLVFLQNNNNNI